MSFIPIAFAEEEAHIEAAYSVLGKLEDAIIYPLMILMMAVAFFMFVNGILLFLGGSENEESRKKGRRHMIIGILGFLVMIAAYSIIQLVTNTFGIDIRTEP